jgi:hypothetical protein
MGAPLGGVFAGALCKRSEWLRQWNVRQAAVLPPTNGGNTSAFVWRGGAQPGSILLDHTCIVRIQGGTLIVLSARRKLYFRAADGGASIDEWHAAIMTAVHSRGQTTSTSAAASARPTENSLLTAGLLPPRAPPHLDSTLAEFHSFDNELAGVLGTGAIRLLDAGFLRGGGLHMLTRRQELEVRERKTQTKVFLTPQEAANALCGAREPNPQVACSRAPSPPTEPQTDAPHPRCRWSARRRVCFVTHAWRTLLHPDPDGATARALVRFLQNPMGKHVVGVFVDFACLPQRRAARLSAPPPPPPPLARPPRSCRSPAGCKHSPPPPDTAALPS